jgi:hypothetical protein
MAELISRVRGLIGDPAGSSQTFTDDEVQAALDRTQLLVRTAPLRPVPTLLPGGIVEYREHLAGLTDWEAGETLTDAAYQPVTPTSADRLTGRWVFASPGQPPPVLITGATYDVAMAAALLLEQWAARLARQFDLTLPGGSFSRSQQARALQELAVTYRRQARPMAVSLARTDLGAM